MVPKQIYEDAVNQFDAQLRKKNNLIEAQRGELEISRKLT